MINLNRYNESFTLFDIGSDINHIFVDLKDDGFNIKLKPGFNRRIGEKGSLENLEVIRVEIDCPHKYYFNWSDIVDHLKQLASFLDNVYDLEIIDLEIDRYEYPERNIDVFKSIDDVDIEKNKMISKFLIYFQRKNKINHIKKYNEIIKLNIKVGDILLGGRFKNKKTVIKKIGKDIHGDPTINGKPLLKFRTSKVINESKEDLDGDVDSYLAHLKDDGFDIDIEENSPHLTNIGKPDYVIRVWKKYDNTDSKYSYANSKDFLLSEISDEIIRFNSIISKEWEIYGIYCIITLIETSTLDSYLMKPGKKIWKRKEINDLKSNMQISSLVLLVREK